MTPEQPIPGFAPEESDIDSDLDQEGKDLLYGDINLEAAEKEREEFDQKEAYTEQRENELFEETNQTIQETERMMDMSDNVSFQYIEKNLNELDDQLPDRGRMREAYMQIADEWRAMRGRMVELQEQIGETSETLKNLKGEFSSHTNTELTLEVYLDEQLKRIRNQNLSLQETFSALQRFQENAQDFAGYLYRWSEEFSDMHRNEQLPMAAITLARSLDEVPDRLKMVRAKWNDLESKFDQFGSDISQL